MYTIPVERNIKMSDVDARIICVALGINAANDCELLHKVESGEVTLISKRTVKDMILQNLRIILQLEIAFGCKLQESFRDAQGSIDMVELR